jgi:hypothetical protein
MRLPVRQGALALQMKVKAHALPLQIGLAKQALRLQVEESKYEREFKPKKAVAWSEARDTSGIYK